MRLLILSSDPTILSWKTLPAKIKEIKDTLKVFDVDVIHESHIPTVINNRISSPWLNSIIKPHFDKGYDIIGFHFSAKQCKEWGIKGINGANPITNDEMGDLYFWSDEDTKRLGLSQFVQTLLHEVTHEYYAEIGQKDITHEYHAPLGKYNDIKPLVASLDWNKYQPRRMALKKTVSLLETIIGLYKRLTASQSKITLYKVALAHLGTDASPSDHAPDELGCAETVSNLIQEILPDFPIILGTWTLNEKFKEDPRFKAVTIPMPGDIIMCPTGMGNGKFPGHVGIVLAGGKIASNTSANGKFEQNYTLESWTTRWKVAGGFPIFYYSLIK